LYGNLISTPSPCMSVIPAHICVASAALPRMLVETAWQLLQHFYFHCQRILKHSSTSFSLKGQCI
jgi:hypothetical protein